MNISTGADKEQFPYGLGRTAAAKKQTEEKGPRTDAFSSWLSLFDDLQTVVCFFYFFFSDGPIRANAKAWIANNGIWKVVLLT